MGAGTRHADAPTRDAARDAARDDADAKTTRRAAMPPKKTFTVATKEDLELRRKYELLRQKKEARARREEAKAREDARVNGARMRAASGARGDARGTTREGAESSGRGRDGGGGRGGRGGRDDARGNARVGGGGGDERAAEEPVDPAHARAKAILAGLHKKKEPGVAALNARAAATTAAEKESEEDKKPKLVFTMGKRAPKVAPVVVKAAEEETFGYADTVVGYASTETKAPEPEAAPEAEAKAEPVEEAPAPVEEDASQGKKEVKRPKRPGLLSPGIAKRQKMNTPTPFPEATDGVGERTDKGEREIFISDLPDGCTIESLSLACYRYGRVNSCRVIERKHFGFVTFADSASAEKIVNAAIAHMNDPDKEPVIVDGRVVMVEYSVQAKGDKPFGDEIRQRALEELERIRDGEIVDDGGDVVKRDMLVYDDI
jgi:hypothetical protein